jgi:hypothetical protein
MRELAMDKQTREFCDLVRNRSTENRKAMRRLNSTHDVLSPAIAILRQELDSMVRVIYLLAITNISERMRLIDSTLRGEKWKTHTRNGKVKYITDREMVDLAQSLQGWTQSVYRFGCAFVHLSDFHNHLVSNPFAKLTESERTHILSHMRCYHGGPTRDDPDMNELSTYVPRVFDKIADNLECYLEQLEEGKIEPP